MAIDESFLVRPADLNLRFLHGPARRALSYGRVGGAFGPWRDRCRAKLAELLGLEQPQHPGPVRCLRQVEHEGVTVQVLTMEVCPELTVPAYLLLPRQDRWPDRAVMAIHGHSVGAGEGCLGLKRGGHNGFALALAKEGHKVLLPLHRGFGPLRDLAAGLAGYRMDYEQSMHFAYVTDTFLHGRTVVGENVADLLRWEQWLAGALRVDRLLVAGLSYGGDLSLAYPPFSSRVERIFASGSSGSFALHFCRCYNGPAHCVPGILDWMERSDVAGLNAPRPLVLHYGELDTPCLNEPGRENYAAAYNEAVPALLAETRQIYAAAGAAEAVQLRVTPGVGHVLDVAALAEFFESP